MEIVSEPDMRSPAEAREYLVRVRQILRYLGVSEANMEEWKNTLSCFRRHLVSVGCAPNVPSSWYMP